MKNTNAMLKRIFNKKQLIFILIISSAFYFNSCIFVKPKTQVEEEVTIEMLQKPQIEMSDDALRSPRGDMICLIPKGWFFTDLSDDTPKDVFAIAVNPEYTLSIVFSSYQSNEMLEDIYKQQHMIGLANASFDRKQKRTGGSLIKFDKIYTINSNNLEFAIYHYRTRTQPLNAFTAIFKSSMNIIYEVTIIPMNLSGITLPTEDEMNKIFNSIISTIRY